LSRDDAPKQFHDLIGTTSLLSETVQRALKITGSVRPIILTAEAFAGIARDHAIIGGATDVDIILEPAPRNTAPAAALAALAAATEVPDAVVALLPSDHHIGNEAAFLEAMEKARGLAEEGVIATLGIIPDSPQTGYGYIRRGSPRRDGYVVSRFVEKPNAADAAAMIADGKHYWNAGIFVFRADVFLSELNAFRPDILAAAEAAWQRRTTTDIGIAVDRIAWNDCPSESIDFAVAERTTLAAVVPGDFGWNDVGSWASLKDLAARDVNGNTLLGDVSVVASSGCYVRSESRHISLVGVSDIIVVETEDAVLIVHKDATQQVKAAAEAFRMLKSETATQ
jgi:mannose-1-phosphate guanylyltransferase/mannose-6-phosphate isomerase